VHLAAGLDRPLEDVPLPHERLLEVGQGLKEGRLAKRPYVETVVPAPIN
jgi:hypothetical protein